MKIKNAGAVFQRYVGEGSVVGGQVSLDCLSTHFRGCEFLFNRFASPTRTCSVRCRGLLLEAFGSVFFVGAPCRV